MAAASPEITPPDTPLRGTRVDPAGLQRHLAHAPSPWLHGEIARRMAERLSVVKRSPERVLDWWSPTSTSSEVLRSQYPQARVVPVGADGRVRSPDVTPGWWQRLRPRSAPTDAPGQPPAPAGLLWANMMLHWVDDLPAQLRQWHAATEVDGFLMFSAFGPDTLRRLSQIWQQAGWGPAASTWTDMHDLGDELVHAGFADPVMDMERLNLSWADADALLAELRTLGRNTAPGRHAGLRTPRWHARMQQALTEALSGPDGRLHLGFEIVYGHAFRPVARAKVEAETRVSLDTMREMMRKPGTSPSR